MTGGCRDGLHPDRANENQGAESTPAFLQSLLELRLVESIDQSNAPTHKEPAPLGSISALPASPQTHRHELAVTS
jgi:hypothetical protein